MSRGPYELPDFDVEQYAAALQAQGGVLLPPPQRAPVAPPQPPAPRSPALNIVIAWIVIAASVLTIFGVNLARSRIKPVDTSNPTTEPSVRFELVSRYAVGAMRLLNQTQTPKSEMTDAARALYVTQAEKYARTTVDQARLIPVIAAVEGEKQALLRLEQLQGKVNDPALQLDLSLFHKIYDGDLVALTSTERQALVAHHGWFGRLALSWNAAPGDPDACAVLSEATRTFAATLGLSIIALMGVVAGLVLFVIAMVLYADRRVRLNYVRADQPTVPFLEGFAVYVGGSVLLSLVLGRLFAKAPVRLNWAVMALGILPTLLALCWPLLRGTGVSSWRHGLGWHSGKGLFREIGLGLVGYIAGLPIVALGTLLTLLLTSKSGADPVHPIINEARGGAGAALRLYLLAAVYAPLVEESLFRGALFHHLRGRHGWWLSSLLVSVIFAAMHPQGWAAIPTLAAIAIVFAAIREWRGTMFASAAAHALNNGLVTTMLILALS